MEKIPHSLIIEKLKQRFGDDIKAAEEEPLYQQLVFTVNPEKIVDILRFLFDDKELQFQFLTTMFCVHYPDRKGEEMCMYYLLHNFPTNTRIRLKAYIPVSEPVIDSATPVFKTANWMEREAYDFFGIEFKGHPDLRRILNMDSMDYFPMRKEFPLEERTRSDKDDTMFGRKNLTIHNEPTGNN